VKIAFIRKNYRAFGGAENYLNHVAKALKAKGHDIHVFSAENWPDNTLCVHKIGSLKKPSFISQGIFAFVSRAKIKREHFDCVISFDRTLFQDIYRAGDGCHREWLSKRKRIASMFKKASFLLNPHHHVLLYLEKKCFLNSKLIIANSNMVRGDITKHYSVSHKKIKVVYNGVDLKRFRPIDKLKKTDMKNFFGITEGKVILYIGADAKRKGLTTLLKAYSLLPARGTRVVVVGCRNASLLSLTRNLGIDEQVTFWSNEKEIEKVYLLADVFVLPTIYDPFSNATLEAMASGLPVITTSSNGASELIDNGMQGYVLDDPLDTATLSQNISAVLQNSEHMGNKARLRAEDCSLEKAVNKIMEIISDHGRTNN
jgi:UDP-glucose:(heptosyl)LPS alpha-1,3-glucosyltransferase